MDSIEEDRLYKMRQNKNAKKKKQNKHIQKNWCEMWHGSNSLQYHCELLHSSFNFLNSFNKIGILLTWPLGCYAGNWVVEQLKEHRVKEKLLSVVHCALSGYIMFFTLYVTLAKSYYGLWEKKQQLHEEKIHLTQVAGKNWFFTWLWWGSNSHWSRCG